MTLLVLPSLCSSVFEAKSGQLVFSKAADWLGAPPPASDPRTSLRGVPPPPLSDSDIPANEASEM
jgi:hypothetical protein